MSAAPTSLPSEYEIVAESLVRVFALQPDLLLAIERAITRHRSIENVIEEAAPILAQRNARHRDARHHARAIRQIIQALVLPQYQNSIDRKSWQRELERYQTADPALVAKIRGRVESQIPNSETKPYDQTKPDGRCDTR